jgi:hypothetical protein
VPAWRWALAAALLIVLVVSRVEFVARGDGEQDLVYFVASARLFQAGENPYDFETYQAEVDRILGRPNPYPTDHLNNPVLPVYNLVFAPVAPLSFPAARRVCDGVLWLLFAGCGLSLLRRAGVRRDPLDLALGLCVLGTFMGTSLALRMRQTEWIILASLLLAVRAAVRGRDFQTGLWLGLAIMKPQLGGLVAFGLFLRAENRPRLLAGTAVVGLGQFLPWAVGWRDPAELAAWVETLRTHGDTLYPANQNLNAWLHHDLLLRLPLGEHRLVAGGVVMRAVQAALIAFGLLGTLVLWRGKRALPARSALAWTLALTLLIAPYSQGYSAVLLLPLIAELLPRLRAPGVKGVSVLLLVCALNLAYLEYWVSSWRDVGRATGIHLVVFALIAGIAPRR